MSENLIFIGNDLYRIVNQGLDETTAIKIPENELHNFAFCTPENTPTLDPNAESGFQTQIWDSKNVLENSDDNWNFLTDTFTNNCEEIFKDEEISNKPLKLVDNIHTNKINFDYSINLLSNDILKTYGNNIEDYKCNKKGRPRKDLKNKVQKEKGKQGRPKKQLVDITNKIKLENTNVNFDNTSTFTLNDEKESSNVNMNYDITLNKNNEIKKENINADTDYRDNFYLKKKNIKLENIELENIEEINIKKENIDTDITTNCDNKRKRKIKDENVVKSSKSKKQLTKSKALNIPIYDTLDTKLLEYVAFKICEELS